MRKIIVISGFVAIIAFAMASEAEIQTPKGYLTNTTVLQDESSAIFGSGKCCKEKACPIGFCRGCVKMGHDKSYRFDNWVDGGYCQLKLGSGCCTESSTSNNQCSGSAKKYSTDNCSDDYVSAGECYSKGCAPGATLCD